MATSHDFKSMPALAFDSIAQEYDNLFTHSVIGKAQREQVWSDLATTFRRGDFVLELNCGTGEDAIFLARHGLSVFACDVSAEMIRIARKRHSECGPLLPIQFEQLANEDLHFIRPQSAFNGIVSNFSGLNCVADLRSVSLQMARLLVPGAPVILCMSTRICVWETLWYLGRGRVRQAFRRWPGCTFASVNGHQLMVQYPSVRELRELFAPWFELRSVKGVGVVVPPTYCEAWVRKHRRLFALMCRIDSALRQVPVLRELGDHVLLHFERTAA